MEDPGLYTQCCAAFIGLLLRHYSEREVLILLKDLARHMRDAAATASAAAVEKPEDGKVCLLVCVCVCRHATQIERDPC